jgi:flagellar hook protein FlgE
MNSDQGSIVGASAVTDLAVQGNGFFVVTNAAGDTFLTRDGSFVPDASGNLVNASGYYLMGTNIQNGNSTPVVNSLSGLQKINVDKSGEQASPTTSGTLSANLPSTAAVVAAASTPAGGGTTYTEKTSLVTYDNLGAPVTLDIYMTKIADNPAASAGPPAVPGTPNWEVDVYNQAGAAAGGGFPYSAGSLLTTQTLTFNPANGQLAGGSPLSIAVPNGQTMSLDMSSTTQLAAAYTISGTTNGNAPDTITGVSINASGTLSFNYSSGTSVPGYVIPLVNVASPDNMTSVNGTAFSPNINSGQPEVGVAGTAGFGSIESSSLESSTVDLATELTAMIQAQAGYEANSKVFQTGANLLDILNKIQA